MAVKVKERKGKYWVFIDWKGKRKAKCVGSKRAAEQVAAKIEAKLTLGQFEIREEEKPILFADYAGEWLRTYATVHCKPSTVEDYQGILSQHLKSALDKKGLREITREDVKRLIAEKTEGGLSYGRVLPVVAVLRSILNQAVEDGHLATNPAARLGKLLKRPRKPQEIRPLTREELSLFLETVREHFPAHYPLFLTLARTGMRIGEALALKWEDIDFHGGFIEVRRGLRKKRIDTPKSGKGRRVDMSRQLRETLLALLEARKEEAWRKGWEAVPEWVFCNGIGKLQDDSTLWKQVFLPALHHAGLRRIRIHDLRHTFASLLIQQGESLAYIKEQLGHHSIKITVDTYGHLIPGSNRQAVDKLDDPQESATDATARNPRATITENPVMETLGNA